MKKTVFLLLAVTFMITACNQQASKKEHDGSHSTSMTNDKGFYGSGFNADDALDAGELVAMLEKENPVQAKVRGKIIKSCKHSGCWMDVDLGEGQTVHVIFEDDSFTIPLDAEGRTAIFTGVGSREEVSVELLKAYAKDEGKPQEEIDAITEPGYEYSFVASGVILLDE